MVGWNNRGNNHRLCEVGSVKHPHEVDVGDLVWFRSRPAFPLEHVGIVTNVRWTQSGKKRFISNIKVIHQGKFLELYSGMYEIICSSS